ncbi:MAG: hypothetical protein ACR2OU_14260 [Thermomicrobiales bacterium]
MVNVSDGHRAGHGFSGLRKRYIRRAEFLAQDKEFRAYVNRFRAFWNQEYPIYELRIVDPGSLHIIPTCLFHDWRENHRQYDDRLEDLEEMERNGATGEEIIRELKSRMGLLQEPARIGMDDWTGKIGAAVRQFFPFEDFPNPYPNSSLPIYGFTRHFPPAHVFVGVALQTDPRLITDFDSLFEPMELEPIDIYPYGPGPDDYLDEAEGENHWDDEWEDRWRIDIESDADLQWYLPLYPGITEADIRRAAPEIAQRMNEIYGSRTASARALALRNSGCTHRDIANRLGLTEQTVAAILKKSGQ